MPFEMERSRYNDLFGPTVDDRFRLADTNLIARIERDFNAYGDEHVRGWGGNLRTGMMLGHSVDQDLALDAIVTNVIVVDPVLGIFKGDLGIKDGRIAGFGRAGNPDIMDDVDLVIGPNTLMLADGGIATPGGVDSHVHLVTPKLMWVALSAGLTTLIGGGLNHNNESVIRQTFEAFEGIPLNLGLQGRGSASHPAAMIESIESGACGLKIHEDTGAYPYVVDLALRVADEYDVSVALHTDGLHESMEVSDTIETIAGRAVHAYHVEGCGGGHAPDLLRLAGVETIIPSSTTPTIPYTVGTYQEHFAMTALIHGVDQSEATQVSALDERLRRQTMAAEDVLHDMGAIPVINSDSQGMGRIGEVISRTWQLAHKMKGERGSANPHDDNDRILQYLAKYTINPAITHGISAHVGSLEPGKLADIVLWSPGFFGVKPQTVIKSGVIVWTAMGEGNASVGNCEPVQYGPAWGSLGHSPAPLSYYFVSQASLDRGIEQRLGSRRKFLPVSGVRQVTKKDMVRNNSSPHIEVDLRDSRVMVDGRSITSQAVEEVPLNRLYMLS
jgi:urease subunit alpha